MKNGGLCCLMLFRTDDFGDIVNGFVKPVMRTAWMDDKGEK